MKKISILFRWLWFTVFQWLFRNSNPYIGIFGFKVYKFQAKKPTRDFIFIDDEYFYPLIKIRYKRKIFSFSCILGTDPWAHFRVSDRFKKVILKNYCNVVLERKFDSNLYFTTFPGVHGSVDNIYIIDLQGVKRSCANYFIKYI